jgi:hypothetical protein
MLKVMRAAVMATRIEIMTSIFFASPAQSDTPKRLRLFFGVE